MQNKFLLPSVIVLASLIISIGLIVEKNNKRPLTEGGEEKFLLVDPIESDEHILGSPNAKLIFIVFSDYDCSFCSVFNDTMHKVIEEYGKEGAVAWVFRHFPVKEIHPDAEEKSLFAECSAITYGENVFFDISDKLFRNQDSLEDIAEESSVEYQKIKECVEKRPDVAELVEKQRQNALGSGAIGSPYTIIVMGEKAVAAIDGAISYVEVKRIIEDLLYSF